MVVGSLIGTDSIAEIFAIVVGMRTWVIGIDEAGRGPLAGPVAVGVALVPACFDWGQLPGVTDSKKLSEKRREAIYIVAKELEKAGQLATSISLVSAKQIDKHGIVPSVNKGIVSGLQSVTTASPRKDLGEAVQCESVQVLLDGGLKAPAEWVHQETIIQGDSKEKVIGLASIMAKVTRDRYMQRVATQPAYTMYNFAQHKGYGTKAHRETIATHGLSPEHRASYCKNIQLL